MSSDEKKNHSRPITGILSSVYTAQHAILPTLSLLLLLSSAIPSVGAQPSGSGMGTYDNPVQRFSSSMAIIIVVLIAALFLMAFFSIYIRNCSGNAGDSVRALTGLGGSIRARRAAAAAARGLDEAVIETFPTFVYSIVKGLKIGKGALECAVCLNEFEDDETLRLIPKCDHVFHPECIDEWLSSHVTCPVCRANLVPEPGESLRVRDLEAELNHIALEVENPQNGDVTVPVIDDHDVNIPQPQVVDRNKSVNQNRPPRSRSVRARLFGKFPRSHSTGHSLVQPGENTDRFTLRLPDDVRKQVMNRALNRTTSCVVQLPREGSSRRGFRTGGEGSSRGKRYRRLESLDRVAKSDRWVFSIARPFLSRESSVRSPKVVAADGEGTSVTTVETASDGLDRKSDKTGLVSADSARPPV